MSEFTPINTQEELNAIIADRIKRAEEAAKKPYADYEDLKKKVDAYEKTIGELNDKIKGYETANTENGTALKDLQDKVKSYETQAVKIRIAHEVGIPYDLAERLTGDSEDAIKADAENLKKYMAKPVEAPIGAAEPETRVSDEDAALLKAVNDLTR